MIRYGCGVIWSRHALRPEALDPRFWYPIRPAHGPVRDGGGGGRHALEPASRTRTVDRVTVYLLPGGRAPRARSTFVLEGMTLGAGPWIANARSMVEGAGMVAPVRAP